MTIKFNENEIPALIWALNAAIHDESEFSYGSSPKLDALQALLKRIQSVLEAA